MSIDAIHQEVPAVKGFALADCWRLLLVSFLSLYVELVLIRWIPTELHVVGFFSNLVLIACFLGLGIGMSRALAMPEAVWRAFFRLAIAAGILGALNGLNPAIVPSESSEYALNEDPVTNLLFRLPMLGVLLVVFGLGVWTTIPFGQLVAVYFDRLERIPAYSINITGSLFGVLGFAGMAWLELSPLVWFFVALMLLGLLDFRRRHLIPCLVILVVLVTQHLHNTRLPPQNSVYWSPYYKVVARPLSRELGLDAGFITEVNDQFLLSGFDLRPEAVPPRGVDAEIAQRIQTVKAYYDFPFRFKPARRVLVLGSGAGNDVAAALRHGAEQVTAVEIDPVVLRLGSHHPEKPYQSPRVQTICDDARAFLNRNEKKFDLIIFATLDAHGLLASVGNMRLDSFVYTRESLKAAREHLAPGGSLILSFGPFREETQFRQYATVRSVFSSDPLYFMFTNQHRTIVAGDVSHVRLDPLPKGWRRLAPEEITAKFAQYPHAAILATDDWPHLYIREPKIPNDYISVLAGVLLLSVILVGINFRGDYKLDGHFFFLGSGFLLLETKSVTEFALLIGSTWQVNVLVFSVILVMILLANLVVLKVLRRVSVSICYGLLLSSLAITFVWPLRTWTPEGETITYLLAAGYLGVPIFLAAILFATTFQRARLGSAALASNLLGAVLGGTTEYFSLAYGLRALSLFALGMYGAGYLCWLLGSRNASCDKIGDVEKAQDELAQL